jgi:SAM-dependent methyltransferase
MKLNIGCGKRYHKDWVNIDINPRSKEVRKVNILKGLPYKDNYFDAVYHSHVLEHLPKDRAEGFIKECYRVLKPGGILRVVVPDLENIVREYLKCLGHYRDNYDWIMLELLDQMVRTKSGGDMIRYLETATPENFIYASRRIGSVANEIRFPRKKRLSRLRRFVRRFMPFRAEVHRWMYDSYSLPRLLEGCGFLTVHIMTPEESCIPDFDLDVRGDEVLKPGSLFVEGCK